MGRFKRRFRGQRSRNKHKGNKHGGQPGPQARPEHALYRQARKVQTGQQSNPGARGVEFPVYQARVPGHLRIMGQIEFEVRNMLRAANVPPEQVQLYLSAARQFYADFENTRPEIREAALNRTTEQWLARRFDPDIIKRIRAKVTYIHDYFMSRAQQTAAESEESSTTDRSETGEEQAVTPEPVPQSS